MPPRNLNDISDRDLTVTGDPDPVDQNALSAALLNTGPSDDLEEVIETERDYTNELERELARTHAHLQSEVARINRLLVDAMHAESAVAAALSTLRKR